MYLLHAYGFKTAETMRQRFQNLLVHQIVRVWRDIIQMVTENVLRATTLESIAKCHADTVKVCSARNFKLYLLTAF